MDKRIKLETRLVGEIKGVFRVCSYQRGYRWGKDEVTRLLDDVYTNANNNYCLQPIVVKSNDNEYELIDGQQRLTTIYLIYKFMHRSSNEFFDEPRFSLCFETRKKSKEFLEKIDPSLKNENIDFWFISEAYQTIMEWFSNKSKSVLTKFNEYFDENVKVIWYEVDSSDDPISLFTRLNIGKIPLTSSELVKATFLSQDNRSCLSHERQQEISLQWDSIEQELQNDSLWLFLTNHIVTTVQTRIDLVLDLISGKTINDKERYFTFFYFDKLRDEESFEEIWRDIQHTFLILKDWFEDHELYHKIGYLITSDVMSLTKLFHISKEKTKKSFKEELDHQIRNSIRCDKNYDELSYEKKDDYKRISRILLLFNVESVRQNGEHTQWFPFDRFKSHRGSKPLWSLEHIHAQQSEGLNTEESWRKWIELHIPSVSSLEVGEELELELRAALDNQKLERNDFNTLHSKVINLLSVEGNTEFMHSISNLALLSSGDNAALNNSTFDVKRNAIIEMDKKGQFIPFCTKMVFLKYYTPSKDTQLHFWGEIDRISYVNAIKTVLSKYLSEDEKIHNERNVDK